MAPAGSAAPPCYDVCVVGGGVVGTAVLRELAGRGLSAALVERNTVGSGVSAGNTGIACTLLDVPEGTLERQCLEHGTSRNLETYRMLGIPHRPTGALYVAWSEAEMRALRDARDRSSGAETRLLDAAKLADEEPLLGPGACGAMLVPGEVVVDPGLVPLAYAHDALHQGAAIFEHAEVSSLEQGEGTWTLTLRAGDAEGAGCPPCLRARHVVSCGGLDADEVEKRVRGADHQTPLAFRPRRGDYVVFRKPRADAPAPLRRPIGSVPAEGARGVYVWPTAHGDVACGPTNVPQGDKELPEPERRTLEELRLKALAVCPSLRDWQLAGHYSGLRPALEPQLWGTDYVIRTLLEERRTLVAGVRSTGLTASLGIARAVADALAAAGLPGGPDARPREAARLPGVEELARDYASRGDGAVSLAGRAFRVSHPLTRVGLGGLGAALGPPPWTPLGSRAWPSRQCATWSGGHHSWQTRLLRGVAKRWR